MVVEEAGERIHDLLSIGVEFERGKDGHFQLAKEWTFIKPSSCQGCDREESNALTTVQRRDRIKLRPNTLAIDLIRGAQDASEGRMRSLGTRPRNQRSSPYKAMQLFLLLVVGQLWERQQIHLYRQVTGLQWPIERVPR